jgi:hypothetical protein
VLPLLPLVLLVLLLLLLLLLLLCASSNSKNTSAHCGLLAQADKQAATLLPGIGEGSIGNPIRAAAWLTFHQLCRPLPKTVGAVPPESPCWDGCDALLERSR